MYPPSSKTGSPFVVSSASAFQNTEGPQQRDVALGQGCRSMTDTPRGSPLLSQEHVAVPFNCLEMRLLMSCFQSAVGSCSP